MPPGLFSEHLVFSFPISDHILVFETVTVLAGVCVVGLLIRFLYQLRRYAELDPGMLGMCVALTFLSLCRLLRLAAAWTGSLENHFFSHLPLLTSITVLIWVPVHLFRVLPERNLPDRSRARLDRWRRASVVIALFFSVAIFASLAFQLDRPAWVLVVLALGIACLMALAFLTRLRETGACARSQVTFVSFTAGGLAMFGIVALHHVLSPANPALFLSRVLVETGLIFMNLGGLFVFANLRLADGLIKQVVRTFATTIFLLMIWAAAIVLFRIPPGAAPRMLAFSQLSGLVLIGLLSLLYSRIRTGLEQAVSGWLFAQPDYGLISERLWQQLEAADGEAEWFASVTSMLQEDLGFAQAAIFEVARTAARSESAAIHRSTKPSAPAPDLLLPLHLTGDGSYALAVRSGPLRGPLLQAEVDFLRLVVRQLDQRMDIARALRSRRERERTEEQLRGQIAEAELRALRAQVQPHFLFNCLNTIAHLCIADHEKAERMTTMLANVFRYVLTSTERTVVPLESELRFLRHYIEIEQIRFGSRLQAEFEIDEAALGLAVPPLLLQPLIENAILHGLAPKVEGGLLRLAVSVEGGRCTVLVEDSGVGLSQQPQRSKPGTQVGLRNVRNRLLGQYGARAELTLQPRVSGGVRALIRFPVAPEVSCG